MLDKEWLLSEESYEFISETLGHCGTKRAHNANTGCNKPHTDSAVDSNED